MLFIEEDIMKNMLVVSSLCAMVIGITAALYAGAPNEVTNHGAEYCKTLNRAASTEPDAVYNNPAGTALMADGLYLYLSNQFVYQPVDIMVRGGDANIYAGLSRGEYRGEKYALLLPDFYLVYKKNQLAVSVGLFGIGGGGEAKYNSGLQMIDALLNTGPLGLGSQLDSLYGTLFGLGGPFGQAVVSKFSGSSNVYCGQVNLAYAFLNDRLSVSLGGRFMMGSQILDAKIFSPGGFYSGYVPFGSDFHSNQFGVAGGIVASVSARPIKDLTVSLRGEWNSPLRLNAKSTDYLIVGLVNSGYMNQGKTHMQMPALMAVGAAYQISGFQISASYIYYFNQFAQMKQREKGYTGGYDVGIGLDYTFKQIPLNIGIGYLWAFEGARPSIQDQLNEELDQHNWSIGFTWTFKHDIKLTIAEIFSLYVPENVNRGAITGLRLIPAKFYKQSYDTAIGITYKVL
jgi:long-chain fatty acid transport protein